jgi:hypothetical protein
MELFHLPRVLKSQLFLAEVPFEGW